MKTYQYVDHPLAETITIATLDNGLKVFLWPKKGYMNNYAVFATRFGSNDVVFSLDGGQPKEMPAGIAHFLEHQLFETKGGNVFGRFAELGASSNAFTNNNMTAYLVSATANFTTVLETLLDFVQEPYFCVENVEKEKGIIEQEIVMYQDHPGWRVQGNLSEGMYHHHPVRLDIAGTVESINQTTAEMLLECYTTFYHPSNMALFVAGDLDPEAMLAFVADNQAKKAYKPQGKVQLIYPQEPATIRQVQTIDVMPVAVPMLALGYKNTALGVAGQALLRQEIITNLLCQIMFGASSELFQNLYEEGLITNDFNASYYSQPDYGFTAMGCPTPQPKKLYQALTEGVACFREQGVAQTDLERIRKKFMGLYVASFNSLGMVSDRHVAYQFKDINFFQYRDIIKNISLEEVNHRLQEHFAPQNHALSVVGLQHGQPL